MSLITINGTATNVTATGEDVVQVVQNATDISQLHDVNTNGASNGDLLIYNDTSGNWEDGKTLTGDYLISGSLSITDLELPINSSVTRPYMKMASDWSPLAPGLGGLDLSGEIYIGAANLTPINSALPHTNFALQYDDSGTPRDIALLSAQGNTDGTHNSQLYFRGSENYIISGGQGIGGMLSTRNDLVVEAGVLRVKAQLEVDDDSATSLIRRVDYSTTSGDVADFIRINNSDGTNDSDIADGSEVKYNFYIKSADETSSQLIGGFTASTHSTNGNQFLITMDNQAQTGSANNLTLTETVTQTDKPLQFPSFSSTDRDAMSPDNGWVLYNSTTNKLQVYADGSWVDLH